MLQYWQQLEALLFHVTQHQKRRRGFFLDIFVFQVGKSSKCPKKFVWDFRKVCGDYIRLTRGVATIYARTHVRTYENLKKIIIHFWLTVSLIIKSPGLTEFSHYIAAIL